MTIKEIIEHLKVSPEDAWYYIQGSTRFIAYKKFKWVLRKHIIEQVEWRRDVAANPCYLNGTCLCCGCDTPAVFFSAKSCSVEKLSYCHTNGEKNCYPRLMSRKQWKKFKANNYK